MEHTPAPWETFGAHPHLVSKDGTVTVQYDQPVECWPIKHVSKDTEGRRITRHFAKVFPCGDMGEEEVEANARLIAAAPDMFKALILIRDYSGETPGAYMRTIAEAALLNLNGGSK